MTRKNQTNKKPEKHVAKAFKWRSGTAAGTWVNSVGISADGSKVVAGTYFYQKNMTMLTGVFAWNQHGNPLWNDTFTADYGINWVSLSRDGLWAAAVGEISSGTGFIYAYDALGHNVLTYKPPQLAWSVALSNDGSYLAAGADALYLFTRIGSNFDVINLQRTSLPGSMDYVYSVAISGNGQWIVAGTRYGYVGLVENIGGTLGQPTWWKLTTSFPRIWSVAIAADGSCCAAAGSDGKVHFFGIPGFPTATSFSLTGCNSCQAVAINDNGSLVSAVGNTAAKAGKAFLFDAQTGTKKWTHNTTYPPNNTSMDGAGKYVAVSDGYLTPGDFYLFDVNGNLLWNYPTPQMDWGLKLSTNGTALAGGSDDSNLYYFSVP
jgi:WD40 repeat protein